VDYGTAETRKAIRDLHVLARKDLELNDVSVFKRFLPNKIDFSL
jgi:hypothetical protein